MATTAFFLNSTTIKNTTDDLDPFCAKQFVGPLVWVVISVPCACVGVPASVWLLGVLVQRQRSGSSNNVYMLNLTVMDLIYNIFKLPAVFNVLVWHHLYFLKLIYFLEGLNYNGRPLFMACSCLDCYMAVVHPIWYMRISRSRYRAVVCVVVWVSTLALSLLNQLIGPLYHIGWGIPRIPPIITITFCDLVVFRTLRKPDPSGRSKVHPQKHRALQTIINSFIMTVMCYLPSLLTYLCAPIMGLTRTQRFCYVVYPATTNSALGSTLLPLLYLGNLGKLTIIRKFRCGRE